MYYWIFIARWQWITQHGIQMLSCLCIWTPWGRSRFLVPNSLDSWVVLTENKAFSLQFLRFRESILVRKKWNRLLLPKICCIDYELSSCLLYFLQEAKKEMNRKKQRRGKKTHNLPMIWSKADRKVSVIGKT